MLDEFESSPTDGLPLFAPRDGSNPLERKAVFRAQLEIKSMPASLVVQIALWPDKLADWAKEMDISPSVVYNMLAGTKPYHRVRALLARRLNVYKRTLDHLIDAPRPEPFAKLPPEPPHGWAAAGTDALRNPVTPRTPRSSRRPTAHSPVPGQTQLNL